MLLSLRSVSALETSSITPNTTTTLDAKALGADAQQAYSQQRYAAAATLYEALSRVKTIVTQDDTGPLLMAASSYARAGQHEQALALWQRVLLIPAAPGARPPGLVPGPVDYRGEARWGMAESRRAQGRWREAFELYRLNRVTSPLDDGCAPTGAAFQRMALAEGSCLENLGRYDEAIELYWPAALNLSASVPPLAMRRLVDLYSATGQLPILEAAMAHEAAVFPVRFRLRYWGRADVKLSLQDQQLLEQELAYSSIPAFERVRNFRQAARQRRWPLLLAALQLKPAQREASALDHEVPVWQRREAIAALALVAAEAVPIVERTLKHDAANSYLQAALLFCRATASERSQLAYNANGQGAREWEIHEILADVIGVETTPLQFSPPPTTLRLPSLSASHL